MYENQTFEEIMERMLERVSDDFDKREGSVIYDALAPAALELSNAYIELSNIVANTFPSTCDREFLLQFAADKGMSPLPATRAVIKLLSTPTWVDIPTGSVMTIGNFNYTVTARLAAGEYEATCDTPGVAGGGITQEMDIIPVVEITGLESITFDGVLDEGTDEESTEKFRERYIESLKPYAFGGNIADYKLKTLSIDGVGACRVARAGDTVSGQVIPGGYVNVYILDNAYDQASQTLLSRVQEFLDPNPGMGEGLAPIGHSVTVTTPQYANITVSLNIQSSRTIDDATVREVIVDYFQALRSGWDATASGIVVRRSKIEDVTLALYGVTDVEVTELKITGSTDPGHNLVLPITNIPRLDVLNITPAN